MLLSPSSSPSSSRDYQTLNLEKNSQVVKCSRAVAVILFLTKDWSKENGGCFKDCQQTEEKPEDTHVPEFNTLLAFHVPRLYQITPVLAEATNRKCVFGWFLQVKSNRTRRSASIPPLQLPLLHAIKQ